MATKAPERLLHRAELEFLTGLSRGSVMRLFKLSRTDGGWKDDAVSILGKWALPTTAYNSWVSRARVSLTKEAA